MKRLLKIVLVSSLSLLCFSCYYDELIERPVDQIDPNVDVFFTDIQDIFVTYDCTQCHDGSRAPDLRPANAYNALVPDFAIPGDPDASELYIILAQGHRNVSADDLALIYAWIDRGALNN